MPELPGCLTANHLYHLGLQISHLQKRNVDTLRVGRGQRLQSHGRLRGWPPSCLLSFSFSLSVPCPCPLSPLHLSVHLGPPPCPAVLRGDHGGEGWSGEGNARERCRVWGARTLILCQVWDTCSPLVAWRLDCGTEREAHGRGGILHLHPWSKFL